MSAIPNYAMSISLLPLDLCKEVERVMNSYWWMGEGVRGEGIRWKKWQDLCLPKQFGGLGFRRIREFNLAMLGKQAWRLIQHPDSMVSKIFKAKYLKKILVS